MLESSISNRFSLQGREEVGTVVAYHAGLSDVRKRLIGRLWARGHVPIISIYHRHHRDRSETSRPALRFCIRIHIEFGLSFDSELPYNYGNRESRQARVSSELDGPVQVRVLVATTAVGMGLDAAGTVTQSAESPSKTVCRAQVLTITTLVFSFLSAIVPSDVSTVIHHTLPPSLSTYWQQAGR